MINQGMNQIMQKQRIMSGSRILVFRRKLTMTKLTHDRRDKSWKKHNIYTKFRDTSRTKFPKFHNPGHTAEQKKFRIFLGPVGFPRRLDTLTLVTGVSYSCKVLHLRCSRGFQLRFYGLSNNLYFTFVLTFICRFFLFFKERANSK